MQKQDNIFAKDKIPSLPDDRRRFSDDGVLNFAGENGTSNAQAIAFNTLYVVVGVIMIVGSRMIFYKPGKQGK